MKSTREQLLWAKATLVNAWRHLRTNGHDWEHAGNDRAMLTILEALTAVTLEEQSKR